jgi:hypothetical protein
MYVNDIYRGLVLCAALCYFDTLVSPGIAEQIEVAT